MALPTYLDLVNDVLVRLREPEVGTVNENTLSKLVGAFVNDAKRVVEDAYNWNALTTTLTATTSPTVFNYALVGTDARFKVIEVYNATERMHLEPKTTMEMTSLFISTATPEQGVPSYYNFNGIDDNGDTQVDLYPIPNDVYQIYFNIYKPQGKLVADSDKILVPSEPVVQLAFARALVDRGEDGGLNTSEAYAMFKSILADYIAIESSRYPEEETWGAN
jgi:hypothetical protein